ncbi:unnamed protein product [Leptosia nina]|uniref:R3H domain-containing protein n=1 Tax=Leptosia nina TaxID=320188 RepID=A0AAV1JHS0_9NEOP
MENTELDKACSSEDGQLTRSRSFKSKQLVRSQAIRESTSPPRTASPYDSGRVGSSPEAVDVDPKEGHVRSVTNVICDDNKLPVQIQITSGGWEENYSEQRVRTRRWLGQRPHSDSSRDFLSYNPRVTCVCGKCACPQCRGKRKTICAMKQDSGVVCSVDCPDCSEADNIGSNGRSAGTDVDEPVFYCRCPERREKLKTLALAGGETEEKSELTEQDLVNFLKDTLNKNPKDRITLLRIEKELHALVNDVGRCIVRFPVMTSYGRMLVHRVAALFQLAHHIDHASKTCVVVSKSGTSGGRVPCTSFKQWCTRVFPKSPPRRHDDTLAKSILKRSGNVSEASGGGADAPRSKSLEQRERDYEKARRRIFSMAENCSQDENQWPWLPSGPVKLLTPDGGRNKLVKVKSLETREPQESTTRGPVSKSHSFGGYTAEPQQPRLLSKQGDLASSSWRVSPSSSGYKTLSLRSTDSVTPSPTGGASPEPGSEAATLVWAVTDLSSVPPGAVVIHPQTGRPLTNPDGSIYHFDPANPPVVYNDKNDVNEKRRGKLEKQHSFMANECDCSSDCRKCCCDCQQNGDQKCCTDKKSPRGSKTNSVPNSPAKCRKPIESSPEPINLKPEIEPKAFEAQPKIIESRQFQNSNFENQKPVESKKPLKPQKSFESQKFEARPQFERKNSPPTNQVPAVESPNQRFYESTNQRPVFENRTFENQARKAPETQFHQHVEYNQNYMPGYRNDEVTPPLAMHTVNYQEPEPQQMLAQNKATPLPIHDPNIRPLSVTNVMYPVPQAYQYVTPCRMDHQMQPMYQPMMVPEEQKPSYMPPSHTDNTFRIDPSYPYPTEFNAYSGCQEPVLQRGYNMGYGQVEVPTVVPTYPVPNVILQPPIQHYPTYQEPIQWQGIPSTVPIANPAAPKFMLHDMYPVVCPNVGYQPYNMVYPQMVPQPYPMCQPVYPVVEKAPEQHHRNNPTQRRRPSLPNSSRNTPQTPQEKKEDNADTKEIAAKIQQIKEQMAQMNTKERSEKRTEWRSHNSGSGILGSYPANNYNGRIHRRTTNDDPQLNTVARVIVNSIRNIHSVDSYSSRRYDTRTEQRPEFKHKLKPDREDKENPRAEHKPVVRSDRPDRGGRDRNRGLLRDTYPMQITQPYLFRQMSPGTWCRQSPGPVHPVLNPPRRPNPDKYPRR